MVLHCYNSACGDAFRIEFVGESGTIRHLLIDAGYQRTYRNTLSVVIASLIKKGQLIDLCIASHIHDDHIGGLEAYIKSIIANRTIDIVVQWWYNPPRLPRIVPSPQKIKRRAISIAQADLLAGYLMNKNLLSKAAVDVDTKPFYLDGMEIVVLSPTREILNKLTAKYSDPKVSIEPYEDYRVSQAIARQVRDYHILINDFNFNLWKEDHNIENAGSIAFLTKYEEKAVLWLADAHPSVIVHSLRKLGYSKDNPLVCDFVKVAHHGSSGNNSAELFEMISCQKYILSVDGKNLHGLPSKACFAQILKCSSRDLTKKYSFYLTCNDSILHSIFDVDGSDVFTTLNFEIIYPDNCMGFEVKI